MPVAFCLLPLAAGAAGVWTRQATGTFAWLHAVHFVDEQRGWAVGGKGALLATEDGGRNWRARRPPTEDALRDVYFSDERTGWLVCERSIYQLKEVDEPRSYLLRTTDGGENWQRVEPAGQDVDARLTGMVFADETRGFVFGELGALYATADGGRTWARRRVPTKRLLLDAAFVGSRHGWLVGAGAALLYTTDGGETWREGRIEASETSPTVQTREAEAEPVRLNAVSFVDERQGWAVGARGAVLSSVDGGRTWRTLAPPTDADLSDVKFFDRTEGWLAGAGGLLMHTIDGGRTWRGVQTGTTHPLERLSFAGRARGWAVGFGGTVMAYAPQTHTDKPPRMKNGANATAADARPLR
ncbi:MAG TPA: YCF48-related protein [Pyrinomonadaceae bacterium]|nr:YCF48-related protein [Pyrinomonadaceae bacterium]